MSCPAANVNPQLIRGCPCEEGDHASNDNGVCTCCGAAIPTEAAGNEACVDCGLVSEWNFAVQHADGSVSWVCQDHGQDGLEGDEPL